MQSLLPSCVHKTHPEFHLGNTLWHFWNMELVASNKNRDEESGKLPLHIAGGANAPLSSSKAESVYSGGLAVVCSAVMIMEERGHWLPTIQKSVTCLEPSNMVVRCNPSLKDQCVWHIATSYQQRVDLRSYVVIAAWLRSNARWRAKIIAMLLKS